jgi:choline kinase
VTLPENAIILAAGRGTRMKQAGLLHPKGFILVGATPIIEQSIQRLRASGIHRIVIVTGHMAEYYERLQSRYPGLIRLVHNDQYADSGSMYSLFLARGAVEYPFLLIESDLIYEQRALDVLLNNSSPDVLLVSGTTEAGDEVYVTAVDGFLKDAGKVRTALRGPSIGEWVGITKLSEICFTEMLRRAQQGFRYDLHLDYENTLVAAASTVPIRCHLVDNLLWSEIDNELQLLRARERIYPLILARDGALPIVEAR